MESYLFLSSGSTIMEHHDMIWGWGIWKQSSCAVSGTPNVIPHMLQRQER